MTKQELENKVKELESINLSIVNELEAFRDREKVQQQDELEAFRDREKVQQQENSKIIEFEKNIEKLNLQALELIKNKNRIKDLEDIISNQTTEIEAFRGREMIQAREENNQLIEAGKLGDRLKQQMKIDKENYEKQIKILESEIEKYKVSEKNVEETIKKVIADANEKIQVAFTATQSLNSLILSTFKNFQGALDNATDLYAFISKEINKQERKGE